MLIGNLKNYVHRRKNMNSILTKIYYNLIENTQENVSDEESILYDQLAKRLNSQDFELFLDFLSLYADRYAVYQEKAFKTGVKFGFELTNELTDIELY